MKVLVVLLLIFGVRVHSVTFTRLTEYVDDHQEEHVQDLREWVSIESDSSDVRKRKDLHRMMDVVEERLRRIGGTVELMDIGNQTLADGSEISLPKVVTARFGADVNKHTVCVYGHVDVQPARMEDGWTVEPYNLTEIKGNLYGRGASDNKAPVLAWIHAVEAYTALWRYPTVSIHGIEGAFSAPGTKTVIPAKVTAKFSIRQVPHMEPAVVEKQVRDHLHAVFSQRNSPNRLTVRMVIGAKPWLADTKHQLYEAGRRAVKRVFHTEPDLIREGGTIPIARIFQDVAQKDIIMIPIGGADDGMHSQNEKISR